eukprot:gene799-1227_t
MAGSHAMERKRAASERAKAGVVLDKSGKPKKDAKPTTTCGVCKMSFNITKRNVEMKTHAEAKHPKSSLEECFPGMTFE